MAPAGIQDIGSLMQVVVVWRSSQERRAEPMPNGAEMSAPSQKAFEDGSHHAITSRPQKAESVRFSDAGMPVKVTSQSSAGAR